MSDRSSDPRAALEQMIAAERAVTPPAGRQAANWTALLGRAAAGPVPATSAAATGTWIVPGLLTGVLVAGLAVGVLRPAAPPAERMPVEVETDAQVIAESLAPEPALADEDPLALIRRAYLELKAGRPDAALNASERYLQRWPDGMLVEEAAAARVLALCALERHEDVARARRNFVSRWPHSLHGERIRNSCKR